MRTHILLPIYTQNLCNLLRISCQMKFLFRKKKKKTLAVESSETLWLAAKAALVLKPIIQCQSFRCVEGCDWQGLIWGPRLTWHLGFIRSGTKDRGKIIREGRRQINLFIPLHLPSPSPLHPLIRAHTTAQPLEEKEERHGITFSEPPRQQVTLGPVLTWNNSMCGSVCKTKGKTVRKAGSREFMWRHIVDNQLVCLCMFGHENKSKAYITVMELLLKQSTLQQ